MKNVALYSPYTIGKAIEDFDRYMESFFGESPLALSRNTAYLPAVDIKEKEGVYLLEMELPGLDEKNIQIHVDNKALTIESKQEEAARNVSPKDAAKEGVEPVRYLVRERRQVAFRRSFQLPENADTQSITAHFKKGVLHLEIKILPEAQKRKIEIGISQE
ncbi:MAG: Hsp20/alpha crystallin family protein [Treponema sp.]|nr:Hsp20/alpha crystallin family protein [Treponema sp.]